MFKTRVLSAIIGIPIILGTLFMGGMYWIAFFLVLGAAALYEFYRMMAQKGHIPVFVSGYILLFLLLLTGVLHSYLLFAFFFLLLITVIYFVMKFPEILPADLALSLLGPAYIGFLLSFAIRIRDFDQSFYVILLAFILTWSSDVGGYLFGSLWGKHKMAPLLSPGKSWEGAAGAVCLTVILLFTFLSIIEFGEINYAYLLLLGISSSILAQFGDLFISAVKRYFGVKDTGHLIPGHGGVLDRFDAFMLVVPLVYFFFLYIA